MPPDRPFQRRPWPFALTTAHATPPTTDGQWTLVSLTGPQGTLALPGLEAPTPVVRSGTGRPSASVPWPPRAGCVGPN
jgi:hypothetical protein